MVRELDPHEVTPEQQRALEKEMNSIPTVVELKFTILDDGKLATRSGIDGAFQMFLQGIDEDFFDTLSAALCDTLQYALREARRKPQ